MKGFAKISGNTVTLAFSGGRLLLTACRELGLGLIQDLDQTRIVILVYTQWQKLIRFSSL